MLSLNFWEYEKKLIKPLPVHPNLKIIKHWEQKFNFYSKQKSNMTKKIISYYSSSKHGSIMLHSIWSVSKKIY